MDEQIKSIAAEAYNAIASHMKSNTPFVPFRELPESLQMAWYLAIVQTQIFSEFPQVVDPISRGEHSASCVWEVTAGLIPGTPTPELTKRWGMTSGERESEQGSSIFTWRTLEASHYLQRLHDPNRLNWVRLDWIWF